MFRAALMLLAAAVAGAAPAPPPFDWSRTRTWLQVGGWSPFTEQQAEFLATHYDIIGLGGTFGGGPHSGEVMEAATARQLKQHNNATKVLIYRNSQISMDMLQSDEEFEANPEWWLRNGWVSGWVCSGVSLVLVSSAADTLGCASIASLRRQQPFGKQATPFVPSSNVPWGGGGW